MSAALADEQDDEDLIHFDIPQQRADMALTLFAEQADITLVFPYDELQDKTANPLIGAYAVREGATILLEGTGYEFKSSRRRLVMNIGPIEPVETEESDDEGDDRMNRRGRGFFGALATLLAGASGSGTAIAQQDGFALEEVTVTARRVEESLQRTPVAVSAYTGAEMAIRGDLDLVDIGAAAPNVNITGATRGSFSSAPAIYIRGIGQDDFIIVTDPAVGVYLDGVYIGRSIGSLFDLVDLERVEVLRGPQGTLFGRNTIGGAISLISQRPLDEFGANLAVTLGEDSHVEVNGSINAPISDGVSSRFSAMIRQRDGHVKALQYDDLTLGDDDVAAFRGQLEFTPSDQLTVNLSADYSREREAGAPVVALSIANAGVPPEIPNLDSWADYYNQSGFNLNPPVALPGLGTNPACAIADADLAISAPNLPDCASDYWIPQDKYATHSVWFDSDGNRYTPRNDLDTWGIALNLTWDSEIGTFTSITSTREVEVSFSAGGDSLPFLVGTALHDHTDKGFVNEQFSQEIQYTNSFFDDQLDVTSGLYYFDEEGVENVRLVGANAWAINAGIAGGPPVFSPPIFLTNIRTVENTSKALYFQGTWHATDRAHLTAGLRYTEDDKFLDLRNRFNGPAGEIIVGAGDSISFDKTIAMVTLGYDVSDEVFAYATLSEGFRSGGFPGRFRGGFPDPLPGYDPETVTAYEIGMKGDFFDQRLRANVAWFLSDYEDMQIAAVPIGADPATVSLSVDNLGNSEIWGLEAELTAVISDNFRIDYTVGYLDSEFDCIVTVDINNNRTGCSKNSEVESGGFLIGVDHELPYSPELNWNLGGTYVTPLQNGAELSWRLNWRYVDEQFYAVTNVPLTHEDSYSVVNAGVTYDSPDRLWSLTVGAKNLGDELYYTSRVVGGLDATVQGVIARPRTFYATLRYDFGGN